MKFETVVKEEYKTDFIKKCSETWNNLKRDGYIDVQKRLKQFGYTRA